MNNQKHNHPISQSYSRRSFLQTTLGSALLLGLSSCDQVEDPLETYSGPEINEADILSLNSPLFEALVDPTTQFPHRALINGALSGSTDPVAIAYRIQYLIDNASGDVVEQILDNLLLAQENSSAFIDYRGFIPNLDFAANSNGFVKAEPTFSLADNMVLSARVAMAANAFTGTPVGDKAESFLNNQKEGYNYYLSGSTPAYPISGNALNSDIGAPGFAYLFNEVYVEMAFVLSYFIGDTDAIQDPQVGQSVWNTLISGQGIPTAQHGDSFTSLTTLTVPLAQNGGANQFFNSLLALPMESVSSSLRAALYNVLFSYLDAARFANLPGIYSAAPDAQGSFMTNNGLGRLTVPANESITSESLLSADALAAALRLFPEASTERQGILRWLATFDQVSGIKGPQGYYGSVDKSGTVATHYYMRQHAALVLFNSTAASHLEAFLTGKEKTSLADMIGRITINQEGLSVQQVPTEFPLPTPVTQLFNVNTTT